MQTMILAANVIQPSLAVTVADADAVVKNRVHWVTSLKGGRGAVREICDLILAARGLDQAVLDGILNQ